MKELSVPASLEQIETVTDFVNAYLMSLECPVKIQQKLAIVIDEVISNIVYYAYGNTGGEINIQIESIENPSGVTLTFIDKGIPYNPLEKEDPDLTLDLEERQIGGMGIFLVKNIMDDIFYKYTEGQNILKLYKKF